MDLSRYLDLFVSESRDHLDAAEHTLDALGRSPDDPGQVRELFRHFHSLKGMAASMGLAPMAARAHDAEELLDGVRSGARSLDAAMAASLREALGRLGADVDRAERREPLEEARAREAVTSSPEQDRTAPSLAWRIAMILDRKRSFPAVHAATVLGRLARLGTVLRSEPVLASLRTGRFDGRLSVLLDCPLDADRLGAEIARIDEVETFSVTATETPARPVRNEQPPAWVRVRADLLDALLRDSLDLLREQSRLDAILQRDSAVPTRRASARCRSRASRLHENVLELRLAPFEHLVQRLQRGVRELAASQGKRVSLEVEGKDVRVDRSLLDAVADPMLHVLRNAVDHGIETPERRLSEGKPATGRVALRVRRERDRVEIAVEDDGRGIDPAALRRQAVEMGFVGAEEAAALSTREALLLVTLPGFSTASRPGEVSGRGVGLDVVRDAVERLGGRIHVEAEPGRGARIRLVVPHTLSGVRTVLVRAGGEIFAVPVSSVDGAAAPRGQGVHDEVPTLSLARRLGLDLAGGRGPGPRLLFSAAGRRYALEVDELVGPGEVLVKPFRAPMRQLPEYAGAGVTEDGSVVLVLDPVGLVGSLIT